MGFSLEILKFLFDALLGAIFENKNITLPNDMGLEVFEHPVHGEVPSSQTKPDPIN